MTTIYKLCFAMGLLVTGGEVMNHGDEHAKTIKKLAGPLLKDRRPDKGIQEIPIADFDKLPTGIQRVQDESRF